MHALGGRARRTVPDTELRNTARDGQQLPVRGPVRGRGVGLACDHPDSMGVVSRAPLRAHSGLRRGLDLGALPSFRATPLDLKGEAHEHLLLGINQLIGHGWPYSPSDTQGLGWFFYAAGALDDRNPWWPPCRGSPGT